MVMVFLGVILNLQHLSFKLIISHLRKRLGHLSAKSDLPDSFLVQMAMYSKGEL